MYLIYVDESGDSGLIAGASPYFVLSGVVVHERRWLTSLNSLIAYRRTLKQKFGLKLTEEIHAARLIHRPKDYARIPRHHRLQIYRDTINFTATLPDISVLNVVINKAGKTGAYDVFGTAWSTLLQRFENTLSYRNFPGPSNPVDHGLVICDATDGRKLERLTRKMRRFNPIPNLGGAGYRMMPLNLVIEDPIHKDSRHSYFVQLADVTAFSLYQKLRPCGYLKGKGAQNWFDKLDPILCKHASRQDPQGIVRL